MSCIPAALSCLSHPRKLAVMLFFAACSLALPAQVTTGNLLTNPGAESGSIAGWTATGPGNPSVDNGTLDPGINPHTGAFDFVGYDGASDSLSQNVSLIAQGITAANIDAATVKANLSFFEQGLNQGTLSDDAFVTLTFLDATGTTLKTTNSGEVDSHNLTWQNFAQTYSVPPGTRSITYTMNFLRHAGSFLDAYVDDNSLTLTSDGLSILPAQLTFPNQPVGTVSAPQVVQVTNPEATTINILDISLQAGASPSDFAQTNNCPAALVAGASCQITFTFVPHGVGFKSAGSEIDDDDANFPTHFVNLTGVGTGGILQVDPGDLKRIAGTGTAGFSGDGGSANAAQLNSANGLAFDSHGFLYIADTGNSVIRRIDANGNITTFAGTGTRGFSGDGGAATAANLNSPFSVAVDASDNVYIQDTGNDIIRKVDSDGIITTIAGTPGTPGHSGDGGPATAARFNENQGGRFDSQGNFFVPTCLGPSIRKINPAGIISTVAGNFTSGFSGDGGPATAAQLSCPSGAATDAAGNLYIADEFNNRIRKVDTTGVITTIAGDGNGAFKGDGGPATASEINLPNDVVVDAAGNIYIADSGNNRVRKIDPTGIITTVAGGLDNAGSAAVNTPLCVTTDASGNLFFCDEGNSNIQQLFPAGAVPLLATTIGTASASQTFSLTNIGNVAVTIAARSSFALTGTNPADFSLTGGTCLAGATLQPGNSSCTLQLAFTPSATGLRTAKVSVADNALNSPQSFNVSGTGLPGTAAVAWAPPAPIPFGTPLGAAQLDAAATGITGAAVTGTYTYTPPAGTILGVGTQTLTVAFSSTDPNYLAQPVTATVPITVIQATPTIAWATPASIPYGTPLSAAQLNASVTGTAGAAIPGTFTYTPAAGTILAPGTQPLTVAFAPQDTADYLGSTTATVNLVVTGPAIAALTPSVARQGDPDTLVTLTGSGFVSTSTVQVNGTAVVTTFVTPTTLTALLPAALLAKAATLQLTVLDPAVSAVSPAQVFTVVPNTPTVTLTGPSTTPPGSQPSLTFTIVNPYPFDLTATFNLTFAGASTPPVDDPAIQFAAGGRTLTFTVPANSTTTPPIQLQAGTVAGTITVPVILTANGLNVTPTTLTPVVIVVPAALPVISTTTITRNGAQLSVAIHGFSNTREVTQATFHFTAATGDTVDTPDVTAQVGQLFTTWYTGTESPLYGSSFTYTQIFNVTDDATHVGSVDVTLTNSIGASQPQSAQ